MPLVTAEHLVAFADVPQARYLVGELLRRLVTSWIPLDRIGGISFHSGSSNGLPGWDGWCRVTANGVLVPHNSLWELSTQNADTKKIRDDFIKRLSTPLPPGWSYDTTAFAMVTLRRLSNRIALEGELRAHPSNPWSDVQILDAPALEQWIELCPAVELWCADYLGIGPGRYGKSLVGFWREWSGRTIPKISTELLLAGRNQNEFSEVFKPAPGGNLALIADSPQEVAAYLYAYLVHQSGGQELPSLLDSAVVIQNMEAAHAYAALPVPPGTVPLTVLLAPANEAAGLFDRHYVVSAVSRADKSIKAQTLKRALRSDFQKSLSAMGRPPTQAGIEARGCGSSVTVWAANNLHLGSGLGSSLPSWGQSSFADLVLPAIFCGGWDEAYHADKCAIQMLSGLQYEDFLRQMRPLITMDNPLLEHVGTMFNVIAPPFAFALHSQHISQQLLERLALLTSQVFGTVPDQDKALFDAKSAAIQVREMSGCSDLLRHGIASTLLWLVEFSDRLDSTSGARAWGNSRTFVARTLAELFKGLLDPVFSYSVGDELPLLAEAAPEEFLDALEACVNDGLENWGRLFADRGMFAAPMHTHLLFTLEVLAWSPLYIDRVADILCKFDSVDPGGNIGNRPINSLRTIFLAWLPATAANIEHRLDILQKIFYEHPSTAWALLQKLMPRQQDTTEIGAKPILRDFGRSEYVHPTSPEVERTFEGHVSLAILAVAGSLTKHLELLNSFVHFSKAHKASFLASLASSSTMGSDEETYDAWLKLNQFITQNRKYAGEFWAVAEADLKQFDDIERMLQPLDVVRKNLRLFELALVPFAGAPSDVKLHQQAADAMRRQALNEIYSLKGLPGIVEVLNATQSSYLLFAAFEDEFGNTPLAEELLALCEQINTSLSLDAIRQISSRRFNAEGISWTERIFQKAREWDWSPITIVELLVHYPDDIETFKLADSLGADASQRFWSLRNPFLQHATGKTRTYAINRLIEHKRAAEAIQSSMTRYPTRLVFNLLKAAVDELRTSSGLPPNTTMLAYHFETALNLLLDRSLLAIEKVAALEFEVFPLLHHFDMEGNQLAVHRLLAKSPEFFIKILQTCCWPDSAAFVRGALDENSKARARIADQILDSWSLVPGATDGVLNAAMLASWVENSREIARTADLAKSCDYQIGRMLFQLPPDGSSNKWPPDICAELLQKTRSDIIETGFREKAYAGSSTIRGVLDGGLQERQAEAMWKARAQQVPPQFNRAAQLYQKIAEDFRNKASFFDTEAAKTRIHLSK